LTTRPLFAYGTLRDPDILSAVLGRSVPASAQLTARAPGYAAVHCPGRSYPALIERPGEAALGIVLKGLSTLDIAMLDAFEGDEYRRVPITVATRDGASLVDAYLPALAIPADAARWTLEGWTRGHKAQMLLDEAGTAQQVRQRLLGRATS